MDSRHVKIYTDQHSPRLEYIAEIILKDILGLSFEIINDRRRLGKFPVINYSKEEVKGSCKIIPAGLLSETGVNNQEITPSYWNGLPVFFKAAADSDVPFDIFSASFFLVTRYEEYLDFKCDEYGRYKVENSIAFKNGFIKIPVIEFWARELAKALLRKYNTLAFKRNEFQAVVTIDVDEPFAYVGRRLIENIGGLLHDLTAKTGQASHRLGCLTGGERDPYEVFDYISDCIASSNSESIFFFPVGNQSDYDRNPSWKNEQYRNLIISVEGKARIGIHPSFKASVEHRSLTRELKRLENITGKKIQCSRFHFLRISMPDSYKNLNAEGISEDYSMGYFDEPGFRAGITRPFKFYDLFDEKATDLIIIPFQIMDLTFLKYKNISAPLSRIIIKDIIRTVKFTGGIFVSIWHNTTLLDNPACREWRELFEFTLKEASS